MKTDSIFYKIFQKFPKTLFDLLGISDADAGFYEFRSVEVKQTRFQIDGLLVPHHRKANLPVYFIETMGYPPKDGRWFYVGVMTEIFLYLNDFRPSADWRAIILFTKRSFDPGFPIHLEGFETNPRLRRLYLDELPQEVAQQSLEVSVLRLISEKPGATPAQAQQLIQQAREERDDNQAEEIIDLIQTILVYKFPDLSRQEIEQMLGIEIKQTKVYQEAFSEGVTEGKAEGLAEGRILGEVAGEAKVALRMLQRGLSAEDIAELTDLSPVQVQTIRQYLAANGLDASSTLDDVQLQELARLLLDNPNN